MARSVTTRPAKAGCQGALVAFALIALAEPVSAMTPAEALAFFDRYCGVPSAENANPFTGLPDGWTETTDAEGLRILAEWHVARRLADGQLPPEEAQEELAFQRDIMAGRIARDGIFTMTDGAGGWMFIADGLHPEFKDRTCLAVLPDDNSAAEGIAATLPFVAKGQMDDTTVWRFHAGYGSGESRESYHRAAFVFTATDGVAYWGLDWRAETLR